jgi:hypothetical protein
MTLVLSPFAQELELEAEDAVLLGHEAQEFQIERVKREYEAEEISFEERNHLFALLRHPNA